MERVGVIGCGIMGCGIAEVSAVGGADVVVCEVNADMVEVGRGRIESSLRRRSTCR